ncbi:hypothetical protein Hanom_Chr15g01386221 [Helianthus anomalus]
MIVLQCFGGVGSYFVAISVFYTNLFLHIYCMISTTMMPETQYSINFFQILHRFQSTFFKVYTGYVAVYSDVFLAALKLIPYEFVVFEDGHKNLSYTELVNKVAHNVFDVDVALYRIRLSFNGPYKETRVECLGFLAAIYSTNVGRHHGFIHHIWNCFMNTRTHAERIIRDPPKQKLVTSFL